MLLHDLLLFLLFFLVKIRIMINIQIHTEFTENRIKESIWNKYSQKEKDFLIENKGKKVQVENRSLNYYHLKNDISIHLYHAFNLDN